jgi:hypothetical protein
VPSPGYRFISWVGSSSDSSPSISIEITCNKSVTAVFAKITYPLAVIRSPVESGKIFAEPPQPAEGYEPDTEITIKAVPEAGYRFSHWSGAASGSENPTTIIMDSQKQVSAVFVEIPWLQSYWWLIVIGVGVIGFLVYFLVIRRPESHKS